MRKQIARDALIGLLAAGVASCAHPIAIAPPPSYRLVVEDQPSSERFELTLISKSSKRICLDYEQWPNGLGQVADGDGRAILAFDGGSKAPAAVDFGFVVCPHRKCAMIELPPGGELHGFVGYDQFGSPENIASLKNRRLEFKLGDLMFCPPDAPSTDSGPA